MAYATMHAKARPHTMSTGPLGSSNLTVSLLRICMVLILCMYRAYAMNAMPTGARRAPEICEACILCSSPGFFFFPPPTKPPTVDPSIRENAMKITMTLTCSQLKNVLSLAKKVLGSILVLTMAAARGVIVVSDESSGSSDAIFLEEDVFLDRACGIGRHMMWYSFGPSPLETKRFLTFFPKDLFLSSLSPPMSSTTSGPAGLPVFTGGRPLKSFGPAGALCWGWPFSSSKSVGLAFSRKGSRVSAISSKLAGDIPPLPSGRNHQGEFLSLLGYSKAMPFWNLENLGTATSSPPSVSLLTHSAGSSWSFTSSTV
mmetsp:Transcript_10/g.26  ORF Transcript_10/g.26 Transcript_10/m.26 type:complete len:314 (-) Transcript_10:1402-2343(-)